jgi:hypothetical protein
MDGRMTDEVEGIWKEVILVCSRCYAGICLEGLRNAVKKSVRVLSVFAKICTEHLLDMSLELYLWLNMLDVKLSRKRNHQNVNV